MDILFSHERISDFLFVEELLIKNRLLIDSADVDAAYPCHLVNYSLYSEEEFFCLLDRNIVSYLIEMVKGRELHEDFDKSKCFRLASKKDGRRWLLAAMDDAIKKTASLMSIKQDESQADYFQRLKGEYTRMWGGVVVN